MPDPYGAKEDVWLPFILNELGASDPNTVVVGHSSGAVAALRLLEHHRLKGAVIVAGYHTDLGDANEAASGYFSRPWEWEKIQENAGWLVQFHTGLYCTHQCVRRHFL